MQHLQIKTNLNPLLHFCIATQGGRPDHLISFSTFLETTEFMSGSSHGFFLHHRDYFYSFVLNAQKPIN